MRMKVPLFPKRTYWLPCKDNRLSVLNDSQRIVLDEQTGLLLAHQARRKLGAL